TRRSPCLKAFPGRGDADSLDTTSNRSASPLRLFSSTLRFSDFFLRQRAPGGAGTFLFGVKRALPRAPQSGWRLPVRGRQGPPSLSAARPASPRHTRDLAGGRREGGRRPVADRTTGGFTECLHARCTKRIVSPGPKQKARPDQGRTSV